MGCFLGATLYSSTLCYEPWLTATLDAKALLSVILGLQRPDFDALRYALVAHHDDARLFSLDISTFTMGTCFRLRRILFSDGVIFGR